MERKKAVSESSSSGFEESSSNEEEEIEQHFVRSDRHAEKAGNKKKVQKSTAAAAAEEEEEDDEEEDDDDDEDDDDSGDDIDGTQRAKASAMEALDAGHGHGDSNSSSETSSASEGKPENPSHQFVVLPCKAENSKKAPTLEKPPKALLSPVTSPKKSKDKPSKRDHVADAEPQERGSSKKQKKENSEKPSKPEKASKEKRTASHNGEKKTDTKKPGHATAVSENGKVAAASHQNTSKNTDNATAKKDVEKSRNLKKATKDSESEPVKGSPTRPKTFRPKEELVLTKEILHNIKRGVKIPEKKDDGYWSALVDRVKGQMEGAWSNEQLCQKVKRMKTRYATMAKKFKDITDPKFRTSTDKELFGLWGQIWGNGDAMEEDSEREVSEVKEKQGKVLGSPAKGSKASREKKTVAPAHDTTTTLEESERLESKHTQHQSSDDDVSGGKKHDDDGDSHKKGLTATPMEVDHKVAHADCALVPKSNAVQGHANHTQAHSLSDAEKLFQEGIQATLSELQESSKQALKEWQSKALLLVENAVKASADHSRLVNGIRVGAGFDGFLTPFRGLDLIDSQRDEGDEFHELQWDELRLKELDLYRQRLELMQKECQLKQDRLKLQLQRNK